MSTYKLPVLDWYNNDVLAHAKANQHSGTVATLAYLTLSGPIRFPGRSVSLSLKPAALSGAWGTRPR